jgi:hypothetical protein
MLTYYLAATADGTPGLSMEAAQTDTTAVRYSQIDRVDMVYRIALNFV